MRIKYYINVKYYHNSGEAIKILNCVQDNKYNGKYIEWYEDGNIFRFVTFKNNKLDGNAKQWYDNGQIEIDEYFKNNKYNGKYIWRYRTGRIKMSCNYKNGKLDYKTLLNYDNVDMQDHLDYDDHDNIVLTVAAFVERNIM